MRDWLGSNAVPSNLKDKLEDGRKLIENDMSRFKDFEREFKTKAFSFFFLSFLESPPALLAASSLVILSISIPLGMAFSSNSVRSKQS
mmetsp:Transcript_24883/g.29344  ORF Transcript_24883/g.29344 Transcript_24883/m.29344 type:complete len:88 (+) Transcript_24883:80-343(+)